MAEGHESYEKPVFMVAKRSHESWLAWPACLDVSIGPAGLLEASIPCVPAEDGSAHSSPGRACEARKGGAGLKRALSETQWALRSTALHANDH